jgi:hypothetical protein
MRRRLRGGGLSAEMGMIKRNRIAQSGDQVLSPDGFCLD